jgi:hypothetical protein
MKLYNAEVDVNSMGLKEKIYAVYHLYDMLEQYFPSPDDKRFYEQQRKDAITRLRDTLIFS